jgi:membrane protein YdbS with pleckstrin-like domain
VLPAEPTATRPGTVEGYLTPGERLLSVTRRHPIALGPTFLMWFVTLLIAFAIGAHYNDATGRLELSYLGAAVVACGTVWAAGKAWTWRVARIALTDQRLLFVQGVVARQINALPLKRVLDTTYRQSVMGRVFGYADITLNLSGQPGLRRLTFLSRPEDLYRQLERLCREA